jgi:hypothetical protein
VASNQLSAWYALGYEQARDGLLWIQYNCRAARGELTPVRLDNAGVINDITVHALRSHLSTKGKSASQLRTMFAPTNAALAAYNYNFYDNCEAYTAGANAYRQQVQSAVGGPELVLKNWLDGNRLHALGPTLSWVYNDPIQLLDVLSQGGWTSATWSMFGAFEGVVNSANRVQESGGYGEPEEFVDEDHDADPQALGRAQQLLHDMRAHVAALPGGPSAMCGSNSFAWSGLYCQQGGQMYPGLLADPHQGLPSFGPDIATQFKDTPNHLWTAHVRVIPPEHSTPTLDFFGHVPYASATFFSGHNRNVAVGGTLGAPNHTDRFVLRLKEQSVSPPNGVPATPFQYYSYYHDASNTNDVYQPLVQESIPLKSTLTGPAGQVPIWRAKSFGFVLPRVSEVVAYALNSNIQPRVPIVYGERVEITPNGAPQWRVRWAHSGNTSRPPMSRMRFWNAAEFDESGQPVTSPMVVAVRSPMDVAVDGGDGHWLLMRDFWEIAHASDVDDVHPRTNRAIYQVNFCAVDKNGSVFSSQMSPIPVRTALGTGKTALMAAGYSSAEKYLIYSGIFGPVPARHSADRMFDWSFGSAGTADKPAPLDYLQYPANWSITPPATAEFKAATRQIQSTNQAFPPTVWSGTGLGFKIQSGFFTSVCNDQVWGYTRRQEQHAFLQQGYAWADLTTNNWLLDRALEAGSAYQSLIIWPEGPDRQQAVVDRFYKVAEYITSGGAGGSPPLTPAQMREFVVSSRQYSSVTYQAPTTPPVPSPYAHMPTPVRQMHEVMQNTADPRSPATRAKREADFFYDLDVALTSLVGWTAFTAHPGGAGQPALTLNLRDLWVMASVPNHQDQAFWYADANDPNSIRWFDMPPDFPLIDFVWGDSRLGGVGAQSVYTVAQLRTNVNGLGDADVAEIQQAVADLVSWGPSPPGSEPYRAEPNSWGAALLTMMRMGYEAQGPVYGRSWRRLHRGVPNAGLDYKSWKDLRELGFPSGQSATLLLHGLEPPYGALYVNPGSSTPQVKAAPSYADVNALVEFFLKLGGHYADPAQIQGVAPLTTPSRKFARWVLAGSVAKFVERLPGNYPLTAGLERVTVFRRLLDAKRFLATVSSASQPLMSEFFRARAYDHTAPPPALWSNASIWPGPLGQDLDSACYGSGLREVVWHARKDGGYFPDRGLQPRFHGLGGSLATIMALFPAGGPVTSYFWCAPGVQIMGPDLRGASETQDRYDANMGAFSTNQLLPSFYWNFDAPGGHVTVVPHSY